jgi:dCTP diphosphatase
MFGRSGHWNEKTRCTLQTACQVRIHGDGSGLRHRAAPPTVVAMPHLTDSTATVAQLKDRLAVFVRERDWEQFHAPKNLSMALAAEAGELMEHFLWSTPEESHARARDPVRRTRIEEELADVVIYALEFANATGIDVAAAVESKIAANALKYPADKARGRSDKYTEL